MTLKLRYFAWVRERIGKPEEEVDVPGTIGTVGELMAWLASRGEAYAHAFENRKVIRAAIDHQHARPEASIKDAGEIAFFPPMTGG
jgi:sulfur-carrier protein